MLDRVIHFSIHHKLIVGFFTLVLIAWGSYSLTQLPIDAVPDITNNQVQVITVSPSLAAQEVERLITFPVEVSMATIPDMEEIRSFSRFGLSVVTIVFHDEVDQYWARQQVSERMRDAQTQIPAGAGIPELAPVTTGLGEIYQYVLHTKPGFESKYTATDLRTYQDWIVRRQLLGTPGIADVSSFGGYVKQYEIAVDPAKLRSLQVSILDLFTALGRNNQNTGGAYIDKKPNAYFIRSEGLVGSLQDIENIVIRTDASGIPLLMRDVAKVGFGTSTRYGAMTRNDQGEVVGGLVLMLKGANSSQVIRSVKERIATIAKTLPEGVVIEPFLDRTKLVNHAIGTVTRNLAEGALIVIFVLVLFLGNFRAGLIVASVIPLSMLFAVTLMNVFGVSGNLMSLGAIDFGLIVDGAVIIVEATMHHLGLHKLTRLSQAQMDEEVYQSASKIRNSAAFGEIIILIVYLPILALVGVEGKMFRPMAQTVSFAILGAFLLSLTYVPMLSALFLSKRIAHKQTIADRMMHFLQRIYQPLIEWALRRKAVVLLTAVIMLGVSLFVFRGLGGEFIPTLAEGDFAVETRTLTGSSLSQTIEAATQASGLLLRAFPDEVKEVVAKIGSGEIPTDPMPVESCDLMIILKDQSHWKKAPTQEALADQMAEVLEAIPGVTFGFQQPIQMRFNELMTGARQDVVIKVYGEELDVLAEQAEKIGRLVHTVKGAQDVYVEQPVGFPQIVITYDREKMAQFGLNIDEVNQVIQTGFAGQSAGLVYEGEKRFDLVVRLGEANRQSIDDVRNLYVTAPNGNQIPVDQIADIAYKNGPSQIQRDDAKRRVIVGFNVRNRDVESIVNEIRTKIDQKLRLPVGYYVTYGGQFENLAAAKERLSVAVPVALLLIFMLLYFTFHSFAQSLLIFTAIPLSAIGGVLALWVRDMPFSISAGVGFIALFGVAVLNGIVLIAYFNQLKQEGMADLQERVIIGTKVRLRPVIMTAAVASLGFLPMALSSTAGAEVQRPLATVVIGGLVSATLLTLVVLPVLYVLLERYILSGKRKNESGESPASPSIGITVTSILLIVAGLVVCPGKAQAQTVPKTVTLRQAVEQALLQNSSIHTAQYQVQAQKSLQGTAVDLGKTSVEWVHGQYNSVHTDNNFTITQQFAFPVLYMQQARLAKAHIQSSEAIVILRQRELARDVKKVYHQLVYLHTRLRWLHIQDSVYRGFVKAAEVRYRTGEANLLEQVTAQTQQLELRNQITQAEADRHIAAKNLQTLLQTTEPMQIADSVLTPLPLVLPDSASLEDNAQVAVWQQQRVINQLETNVEKAKLWPDFNIGYFNQSLIGVQTVNGQERNYSRSDRFSGIQAGISFPLWFRPQASRIRTARIYEQVAESNLRYQQALLSAELDQQVQEYRKQQASATFYEQSVLPQADLLITQATKAYQAGEIDYMEYVQSLNRASSIRMNHLDIVHQLNQRVISIQFLTGDLQL